MTIARLMQQAAAGVSAGGGGGDFTSATYDSAYTFPSAVTNLRGIVVSDDETKFLVNDISASTNYLTRVELTTAGDLSTASVADTSSIGTGTKSSVFMQTPSLLWALDASFDTIKKYTLNADFGNTVSSTTTYAVPAGENPVGSDNPNNISFNQDGTKMFIGDFNADGIEEFSLSTAYNPSTATYTANGSVAAQTGTPYAHCWNNDGSKLYILEIGAGTSVLYQYGLSLSYDVTTMSYDGSLSLTDGPLSSGFALGIAVSFDDLSLYVSGADFSAGTAYLVKYSTAAAAPAEWTDPDLANASYDSVSFSVAGQDTIPVSLFFGAAGEKLFVLGNSNDAIFQYSLSSAYDLSTASYDNVSFSVSSQETAVSCLSFSQDGTLMYISGSGTDSVFQYTLSTAWDLSTASYASKSFSGSSQDTAIIGMSFSASGDTMYLSGGANDTIFQYSLSTPWDISTASYASKSYSASALDGNPRQHFWSPTGDKLWFLGLSTDAVYELDLSTGFDISTAVYNSVSFSVASQDATPTGVFFKSDGSKMYVVGSANDTIYQYSTA